MRFPRSHTGVHHSWQFGLFVEINESSAILFLVKPEEDLDNDTSGFIFLFCGKPLNFKGATGIS